MCVCVSPFPPESSKGSAKSALHLHSIGPVPSFNVQGYGHAGF